jgi:hypothetical protein
MPSRWAGQLRYANLLGFSFRSSRGQKTSECGIVKRRILDSSLAFAILVVVAVFLTVQLTFFMPIRVIAQCFRAISARLYAGLVYPLGTFSVVGDMYSAAGHRTTRNDSSSKDRKRSTCVGGRPPLGAPRLSPQLRRLRKSEASSQK